MSEDKSFKICSVLGGLDITRLVSSNTRSFFGGAIEDVELIREFVSTAAMQQGIVGGLSDFDQISQTLDWEARGFDSPTTTVEAGLGVVDDRIDRDMERFVSFSNEPLVGDKQTDMRILNSVSLVFPWLVDRKSNEAKWWLGHQNGRSEGQTKEPFLFEALYTAAWIGTYGEAWAYYPPLRVYEHPFNFADILTNDYDSHEEEFVNPNFPDNNPDRRAFFRSPYPDTAVPGLSLITAMAPVYFTGTFGNYTYNNTYLASTGLDIAVSSVSTLLDVLENKLTKQSFGMLVDSNFNTIVISQPVVELVYPERTGFEESRVTRDLQDGSIIDDRRNQTYLVSDTILQPLTNLTNADWDVLLASVQAVQKGGRSFDTISMTVTGNTTATEYYVMFERWQYVADWVLLVFAPVEEVEAAVDVQIYGGLDQEEESSISLEGEKGAVLGGTAHITNTGTLDVVVSPQTVPRWINLVTNTTALAAGETLPIFFDVITSELEFGSSSGVMTFNIQDDQYPDCFYNEDLSLEVSMLLTAQDCGPNRVPNSEGVCGCATQTAAIGGNCVPFGVLMSSIFVPLAGIALIAGFVFLNRKRKQAESVWAVKAGELHFDDPPQIVGRGTFGLVLLAEYRGTRVAVKRVIPPREKEKGHTASEYTTSVEQRGGLTRKGGSVLGIELDGVVLPRPGKQKRRQSQSHLFEFTEEVCEDPEAKQTPTEPTQETHVDNKPRRRMSNPYESTAPRMESERTFQPEQTLGSGLYVEAPTGGNRYKMSSLTVGGGGLRTGGSRSLDSQQWWKQLFGYRDEYSKLKADFIEEMKLLSKLRHPCITTVMGAVIEKGEDPMLVMEYMDHGSLYDVLHNETMVIEGEVVLPILRDIAHGLRFLHAATPQVIHGDLKAQNVLVDIKFRAKVADFGLSQKRKVGATGTPLWMAPELLRGESENTSSSDVYSFGIILYEVYSRKDPYHGEDLGEALRLVQDPAVNKRPPVPPTMPPAIVALMCDCLMPNPSSRPSFDEIDKRLMRLNVESIEPGQTGYSAKTTKARQAELNENLLYNVFPKHIAEALRDGRKVEPEHHECVTIFFSDIVGFTTISSTISPMKIADMLDRLYLAFDYLSDEHDVFKVETIGDAWMGVTNLVSDQPDHTRRIAEFAIEAIEAANKTLIDLENPRLGYVQIRVGFHSGPVLSNVVGSRNPHFTIFGDTVNTASRMESNSKPGRILCSERSVELLRNQSSLPTLFRGELDVKGKGMMKTYWVNVGPDGE